MEKKYDVFISYSSKDQKVAEGICGYLERYGLRCFVAYRNIPKGKVWAASIADGIEASSMMVVVFSQNFNYSEQVDRELELAAEDKKSILTYRISNDPFTGAKKYYLKNLNWIDAFPNPQENFASLYVNVCQLLGQTPKPQQQVESKNIHSMKCPHCGQEHPDNTKFCPETGQTISLLKSCLNKECKNFGKYNIPPDAQFCPECGKPLAGAASDEAKIRDAKAQYDKGECYYYGRGVSQDYAEAVRWYRKAAEQGFAPAQCYLGYCYYNGQGVEQSYSEAVKWYRKAAEQSNANAQNYLGDSYYYGRGVSQDYGEAVRWYRKAAEQSDATAQCNLGYCYKKGQGVEQSYSEGVKWYRKAAEQGNAQAQYNLAYCYYYGEGVSEDESVAVEWYRKAAEQGYAAAQYNLGVCYENGRGVSQDYSEAVKWYAKAAEQGDADAQKKLNSFSF